MKISKALFASPLLLASLIPTAIAPVAQAASASPAKLEGMAYPKARRVILGYGWKPLYGNCSGGGTSDGICKRFPETGNCSGTGVGFCDMTFVRKQRCLTLITKGGAPGSGAVVDDVIFSAAPCSKDP